MKILEFHVNKLHLFLTCCLIFFCGCQNSAKSREFIKKNEYPDTISKLGIQKMYDNIKWNIYCIFCDKKIIFDLEISDTPSVASLDLRFKGLERRKDTFELYYSFYYKDTLECRNSNIREPGNLVSGAAFTKEKDSILYYTSTSILGRFWQIGATSRYSNPLQPDVISFIQENKNKLHPWFLSEAKKRGVVK